MLDKNADWAKQTGIGAILNSNRSQIIPPSIETGKDIISNVLAPVYDKTSKAITAIQYIDSKAVDFIAYMNDPNLKQTLRNFADQNSPADFQLSLEQGRSAVNLFSNLIGNIDPKLGQQVRTVGSAAIQVGTAVNKYLGAMADLGTQKDLSSIGKTMASAVLTGNLLAVGLQVFSLFSSQDDVKNTDQMIIDQLAEIKSQIQSLETKMLDRFDRIDSTLWAINNTLDTNFKKINIELKKIEGDLAVIQKDLTKQRQYTYALLIAIAEQELLDNLIKMPGWRIKFDPDNDDSMSYSEFIDGQSHFYKWAVFNATGEFGTGPSNSLRDFTDEGLYDELTGNYGSLVSCGVPNYNMGAALFGHERS